MFWRIVKTLVFSIVAPGTVGILLPQFLRGQGGFAFSAPALPGVAVFFWGLAIYL
jgi:hypothetical protein